MADWSITVYGRTSGNNATQRKAEEDAIIAALRSALAVAGVGSKSHQAIGSFERNGVVDLKV